MTKDEAFAEAFPELIGTISTHYDGCYKQHSGCAFLLGWESAHAEQEEADGA